MKNYQNTGSNSAVLIIGNGVDKSLGLPTGFGDVKDYLIEKLKDEIGLVIKEKVVESLKFLDPRFCTQITKLKELNENLLLKLWPSYHLKLDEHTTKVSNSYRQGFTPQYFIKNKFLAFILENDLKYWFNIEQAYFDCLCASLGTKHHMTRYVNSVTYSRSVADLNQEL